LLCSPALQQIVAGGRQVFRHGRAHQVYGLGVGRSEICGPILLTDLLTDGATRGVIHRHRPSGRLHETPGRQHFLASAITTQNPLEGTHNCKIGVSREASS
jgi:hypothetical protein